jgi:hypothetical protein
MTTGQWLDGVHGLALVDGLSERLVDEFAHLGCRDKVLGWPS